MREYLDTVIESDQCAQYVDIGIAANKATNLTQNIRAVFKCIGPAELKLTVEKCPFGVRKVEFLRRALSPEGISPQARKIQNFLDKLRFPKSKKSLQRYLGSVNYYWKNFPRMAEKPNSFYNLNKTETPFNITSERKETIDSVNKALTDACQLPLKQPIPGKQLVLMRDASFRMPDMCSRLKSILIRIYSHSGKCTPRGVWLKTFLPRATHKVHILKRSFGILHSISRACTQSVGSNKANNWSDSQQVRHKFFPNKSNSDSTMECMWLRAAI